MLADAKNKVILEYPLDGGAAKVLDEPISPILRRLSPSMVQKHGNKIFIEVSDDRILTLDAGYSLLKQSYLHAKSAIPNIELAGMFSWEPVGSDLITFSDLKGPQDRWSSAFVRFPLGAPGKLTELWPYQFQDPAKIFYRLGHPYIASIGSTGYILLMDKLGIYRSRPGGLPLQRLAAFPEKLNQVPVLPSFTTPDDFAPVMSAVERSRMPTGLYSWGDYLYVLAREPQKDGTRWWVTKIDPRSERIVGETTIPSRANHLTLVPGPKAWAFVEKGPVKGFGVQGIEDVLLIPSSRLSGVSLPRNLCGKGELPD